MYLCVCACSMCVSLIYFSEYVANFQLFLLNQSEIASLYTVFDVQELSTPLNVFTHNTDVVSGVCVGSSLDPASLPASFSTTTCQTTALSYLSVGLPNPITPRLFNLTFMAITSPFTYAPMPLNMPASVNLLISLFAFG